MLSGPFGVSCWVTFLAAYLAVVGFMINLASIAPEAARYLPHTIDGPQVGTFVESLQVNVLLLGFFAIPHSIFARPAIKKAIGCDAVYRSVYVLQSSVALLLIVQHWRPLDGPVLWDAAGALRTALYAGYGLAFLWTTTSTFAIDHFELFGVTQSTGFDVYQRLGLGANAFTTRLHYSVCRHPIMLGFFGLFFCVPTMTANHLFFSAGCTAYILLAVLLLEEPDLARQFPKEYAKYAAEVPAFCPFGFSSSTKKAGSGKKAQ